MRAAQLQLLRRQDRRRVPQDEKQNLKQAPQERTNAPIASYLLPEPLQERNIPPNITIAVVNRPCSYNRRNFGCVIAIEVAAASTLISLAPTAAQRFE